MAKFEFYFSCVNLRGPTLSLSHRYQTLNLCILTKLKIVVKILLILGHLGRPSNDNIFFS